MVPAPGCRRCGAAVVLSSSQRHFPLTKHNFMGLDLRWPIGLMFSLIGTLLVLYGLITNSNSELYARSLGLNINLLWGLVLLVFGAAMLFLAWRGSKKSSTEPPPSAQPSPGEKLTTHR
jgi:hypothetical protein